MPIKIKAIEKTQPGIAGGGVKKHYASVVQDGQLTLEGLTRAIEKTSTVNGADIRAVLYAMVEETEIALSEGRIVRLGDLGSLRISVRSEGKDRPEEVTAASIRKANVVFTPGIKLKDMLANAKYKKV